MNRQRLLVVVLCGVVVLGVPGSPSHADRVVLDGIPNYCPPPASDTPAFPENPPDLGISARDRSAGRPICGSTALSGVPTYVWWYGCSPTSGGTMVGYWDGRPGYGGLYDGDASVWGGSGSSGTKRMVAGTAHIVSGSQNGYTYGDYHNSTSYPNHQSQPECVADFMKTVNGGSYAADITSGLEAYVEWDGTWGGTTYVVKQSYQATATNIDVAYWGGSFSYSAFKAEINADRPVLLDLSTYDPDDKEWVGHSVVGYGYQDAMFQIKVPTGASSSVNLTVGGFAIKDTWTPGSTSQSDWYDWSYGIVSPVIDVNGVEWWPFVETQGYSWTARWDWMIDDAVTLTIQPIPEPTTMMLFGLGCATLQIVVRRRASSRPTPACRHGRNESRA